MWKKNKKLSVSWSVEMLTEKQWFRKTIGVGIVFNLGVAAFALGSEHEETSNDFQPMQSALEITAQSNEAVPSSTTPPSLDKHPAPQKQAIIDQLVAKGLKPVADPEVINKPDQFFLTVNDGACVVQFGTTAPNQNTITVQTYVIGPEPAITNRDIYNLDGTSQAQTVHMEGEPSLGIDFPGIDDTPDGLSKAVTYIYDMAFTACDLTPPQ